MTDAELVCAARENNPEAWRELCDRYLPHVWRYAYMSTGDRHSAEDVTSETMLAFLKSIHQLNCQKPQLAAWLRSVVRHKVADQHRGNYRRKQRMREFSDTNNGSPPEVSPSARLEAEETGEVILGILDKLSDVQRSVLEWKYGDGLSVREIALRLEKTEKGVEASLYRARRRDRLALRQSPLERL